MRLHIQPGHPHRITLTPPTRRVRYPRAIPALLTPHIRKQLPLTQAARHPLLPRIRPRFNPILPLPQHRIDIDLMPLPQTLPRRQFTQLQQLHSILREPMLQLQLLRHTQRRHQHAQDLPVDLEAVEQMPEIAEVGGRGVFAVDV